MKRRWALWIPIGIVVVLLAIFFWPRKDAYPYLRDLNPDEHYTEDGAQHVFAFTVPAAQVWDRIRANCDILPTGEADIYSLTLPDGKSATLAVKRPPEDSVTCEFRVRDEPPSWIALQVDNLKRLVHLK
jgi:hypothetical protein